ncbi:hypothetical protein M408DRAFT_327193 [Serendipita vermifera MAFF 305830]|uniref:TauD/TfdA-like domain-containing protein n=1 Tax=Serendipita vermifera MAFF 305830 TaxID=933852 RepID=A0A0C3BJU0_SERVB|nr:hypothetical protein M408DRAFT_327193 [Serendipita vermifera MAFF 305830]
MFIKRAIFSPTLRLPARRCLASAQIFGGAIKVPQIDTPFSLPWLRDSCQCSSCIHPSTRQKLRESSSVSPQIRPSSEPNSVTLTETGLQIRWDSHFDPNGESHTSVYPLEFFKRYSNGKSLYKFHKDLDVVRWTAADVKQSSDLYITYSDIQNLSGLLKAITQLVPYGLVFVTGVPPERTDDTTCELQKLGQMFGEIRDTFYGRVWDVKNVKNSKNIAYTNLNLDLHMDLLYFQNPPRYQILHCLRNRVKGGTSVFVDAFKAAEQLHASSPDSFELLAHVPVDFHYINDGHHLHHSHPTIELKPAHARSGGSKARSSPDIAFVNYSPPFQAPLPVTTTSLFYPALADFVKFLRKPDNRLEYLLKEGDAVIFDNRRVLHARTEFREWTDDERPADVPASNEGATSRWLKGCYLEADPVWDRMRILRGNLD